MVGMSGSKVVLVSGDGVVSLDQHGRVVGLKPGNAAVYTALLHTQKPGEQYQFLHRSNYVLECKLHPFQADVVCFV